MFSLLHVKNVLVEAEEVQPNKCADVSREMICRVADATSGTVDSDYGYEQIFTVYRAISATYSIFCN
jgi:hypothetical protein